MSRHRDSESSISQFYDDTPTPKRAQRSQLVENRIDRTAQNTIVLHESTETIPKMNGFASHELQSVKADSRARGITELVCGAIPEIEDLTVRAHAKVTFDRLDAIVNDNDFASDRERLDAAEQRTDGYMMRQRLYTVDPQEAAEMADLTSDEEQSEEETNDIHRKGELKGPLKMQHIHSDSELMDMDEQAMEEQMENSKVAVPVPDYQDPSIHSIMNDDILTPSSSLNDKNATKPIVPSPKRRRNVIRKEYEPKQFSKGTPPITQSPRYHKAVNYSHRSRIVRSGYQKFESISVEVDELGISPNGHHERETTVQVLPETNALPVVCCI